MKRRHFLKGMMRGSLLTIGLPWLETLTDTGRCAYADTGFPKRFGIFFWGNGNRPEKWTPTGEGSEWQLSETLLPLSNLKEKISVISGLSIKVPNILPHSSGLVGFMTGQAADGNEEDGWTVATNSIDQLIAQEIGDETIYRSIEAGCVSNSSISWNGPNSRNPVLSDPYTFYERIFGETFREPGEQGIVDPRLGYRRSVLDFVMQDIQQLQNRISANDQIRLEQHLSGIRELEIRLARLQEDPPALEACVRPEVPLNEYPDIEGRPQFVERNQVMAKMLAMTLACDQSRVFTYTFTHQLNNLLFPNATDGHHNLTHHEPGEQPQVANIAHFCIEQLATFLQELDAIPEGEGTLLDNCAILATSEVSEGRTHSLDEIPLLIAGGASGSLKTGIHHRSYTQENINHATLSIIRAMGINQTSLGADDSLTSDGLSEIET